MSQTMPALLLDALRLVEAPEDDDEAHIAVDLPDGHSAAWPASQHRLGRDELRALVAAVGAGRPLLVRGEPGVGKSHLARAAAVLMARHFISAVIHPQSEYQDLLWSVDHTARLADAQLLAHEGGSSGTVKDPASYICPGPLWWAIEPDPEGKPAARHAFDPPPEDKRFPASNGTVLLIDEIDKAGKSGAYITVF